MSSIVEKTLIVGFGLFILVILLSIVNPFINLFLQSYQNDKENLEIYNKTIDEIDAGIYYVLANPKNEYFNIISFPACMNISILRNEIIYSYKIDEKIISKHKLYSINFFKIVYKDYPPQNYSLRVYIELELLKISIY